MPGASLIALVTLLLGAPVVTLKWASATQEAVRVELAQHDELLEKCARGGIEVRFRYQVRVCRRRSMWLDSCGDELELIRSLKLDPISQLYRVTSDQIGDKLPAKALMVGTLEEALARVSTLERIELAQLDRGDRALSRPRGYLSVRTVSDCKGEYNKIAVGISTVLTLGLIEVGSFDTGWVDFNLTPASE